ncbi:MAG: hypothetical protein KJO88_09850 [Gammaproteobacteria bacterium]|nr:hypothetical protein [Gammaproteobacteria bacterium]
MKNVLTWLWRLLLLLLLLGITLLWLVETNSGARSLIGLLNTFTNTQVQYTNLNGTLGKLNIDELRVITDEQSVEIKKLSLNWQPYQAIFNSNITIDSLLADTVNIRINESSLDEQTQRSKDLRLPMNMDISNAQFNNVTFVGRDLGEIKR